MTDPVFLGLDLGTSGMRLVAIDSEGTLRAEVAQPWQGSGADPAEWLGVLKELIHSVKTQLPIGSQPVAISACGTSGSVLAVDERGDPLESAWLYNDLRGHEQAAQLGIPASWGLARWLWWVQTDPVRSAHSRLLHPTDFVLMKLGGEAQVSDHHNALKSGFDLEQYDWPTSWFQSFGLAVEQFPRVVSPGTPLGFVLPEWGLGSEVLVVAGTTDGCAGQLAAGAIGSGQVCTSLGTTLIFKAVSDQKLQTPDGSLYSHLHPDRTGWLPGSASACGGGCLTHYFPQANVSEWDRQAESVVPTGLVSYPLWQPGERFPVVSAEFAGFLPAADPGSLSFYAALLEGVALVERWGVQRLTALGIPAPEMVLTTGGGCRSSLWLRIRASVLGRPLQLPRYPQPAVGSAMVAAAGFWQSSVQSAVERLIQVGQRIRPCEDWIPAYDRSYQTFLAEIERTDPRLRVHGG